jgi:hypothetical protein
MFPIGKPPVLYFRDHRASTREYGMNWEGSNPISGGPMTDEELLRRYPDLRQEVETHPDEEVEVKLEELSQRSHELGLHDNCEECRKMKAAREEDWSKDVRAGELAADESRQPKPQARPGYEYISLDQILDAHLGTNKSAALQPGVKTISDVIKELLTIMSEVGDVEVKPFRAAVLAKVEISYSGDDDTVRISG